MGGGVLSVITAANTPVIKGVSLFPLEIIIDIKLGVSLTPMYDYLVNLRDNLNEEARITPLNWILLKNGHQLLDKKKKKL